jgi:hypothetical protein
MDQVREMMQGQVLPVSHGASFYWFRNTPQPNKPEGVRHEVRTSAHKARITVFDRPNQRLRHLLNFNMTLAGITNDIQIPSCTEVVTRCMLHED